MSHSGAPSLAEIAAGALTPIEALLEGFAPRLRQGHVGRITEVIQGVAQVSGLPLARAEELLQFEGGGYGLAFNLDESGVGAILLDDPEALQAGGEVRCTGRVLEVPVGEALLGRVVDGLGRPLDQRGPIRSLARRRAELPSPGILERAPVSVPLQTGIKIVDALFPIGRGQRQLILGDRQTGKTAIAIDTILNQQESGVVAVYCAIGQRSSAVAHLLAELKARRVMERLIVVVASGESPPGLQFIAPYAATAMAEALMEEGRDVLIVYDDLTRHARAYRELSLLLRRPPGREAFPGDIFYVHARLLERSAQLRPERGGGSLTALPIAQTEAQNVSAYIPTNLISITDGQLYLSSELFHKGILPAVDAGRSVSRVGGKAQLKAFRSVAGALRLSYAQFVELESFARFGARLDDATRSQMERGQRVRETFRQDQFATLSVAQQVFILVAVTSGVFDAVPVAEVTPLTTAILPLMKAPLHDLAGRITRGDALTDDDKAAIVATAREALHTLAKQRIPTHKA